MKIKTLTGNYPVIDSSIYEANIISIEEKTETVRLKDSKFRHFAWRNLMDQFISFLMVQMLNQHL